MSPAEATDYGQQYSDQMDKIRTGTPTQGSDPEAQAWDVTPEGLDEAQLVGFWELCERVLGERRAQAEWAKEEAVISAAWKVLEAKLHKSRNDSKTLSYSSSDFQAHLAEVLGVDEPSEPAGFPSSVLEAAPHLKELLNHIFEDLHLEQTWWLKCAYEKSIDSVIDGMWGQNIAQLLPRSFWRIIIEDCYVDFEKLFAGMDPSYDPDDVPKDFGEDFTLIKKEHSLARHPVLTEFEWIWIYAAWKDGVAIFFPTLRIWITRVSQNC